MKKILLGLLLYSLTYNAYCQEKSLYSGGMLFFQPGYTRYQNQSQEISNFSFGLGGLLRFYPTKHLCVGLAGGTQKAKYITSGSVNSYISLGYGGLIFGYTFIHGKMRFCANIGLARGRLKNLHITQQNGSIINQGDFYSYGAWVVYPSLSFDYMLTKKISFTTQLIHLSAVYNENDLYFCPVFQLGVLFNR